jgi:uncharacterized protein (DUF1330 family)
MSIEPSAAQLAALAAGDPTERMGLVRLLRKREPAAYERWRAALDAAVAAAGGKRVFRGTVDGVLLDAAQPALPPGRGARFDELIVDEFPSRELAVESLRKANPHAAEGLAEACVLAASPRALPRFALRLAGFAARLRAPRTGGPRALPKDSGLRAIDPRPEDFHAFLSSQPERPLYVLNLNEHSDRAAYGRYGQNTITQLLRRRAGPVWMAGRATVVVGEAPEAFARAWHEVLLVHYPSRGTMLDLLMDPEYQRGLPHREAGLSRAGLVAACSLPGASGHSV